MLQTVGGIHMPYLGKVKPSYPLQFQFNQSNQLQICFPGVRCGVNQLIANVNVRCGFNEVRPISIVTVGDAIIL